MRIVMFVKRAILISLCVALIFGMLALIRYQNNILVSGCTPREVKAPPGKVAGEAAGMLCRVEETGLINSPLQNQVA